MSTAIPRLVPSAAVALLVVAVAVVVGTAPTSGARPVEPPADGQTIFRFDTFGDEQFWTDTLQLHTIIG